MNPPFAKTLLFLVTVCACSNAAIAQSGNFALQPRNTTISSSIFSKVEVLDSRVNTSPEVGYFEGESRTSGSLGGYLMLNQSLKDELTSVANKLIEKASKQEGTLLIKVRKFYLNRIFDGRGGDFGEFNFGIDCYLKRDSVYRPLFTIDSSVIISEYAPFRIKTTLLDSTHETVGRLIQQAATFNTARLDTAKGLFIGEIEHAGELEKMNIPVYNTDLPKKGLYTTYEDFKNNQPSTERVVIENRKGFSRPFIFEMKENGKKGKEILHKYYYAVCDGENMYVSNSYGLYALTKKDDNDFYFIGKGSYYYDVYSDAFAKSLNLYARTNAKAYYSTFEFKIDHRTGKFLIVKKAAN